MIGVARRRPLGGRADRNPAHGNEFTGTYVRCKRWRHKGGSEPMLRRKLGRYLLALGAIVVLTGGAAQAQNIDQGKSATRLFADSCATCHHNPRGLAKGRFRLTLYMFLQQHYAANSNSAWALTSYLESVDTPPPRGRSRTGA